MKCNNCGSGNSSPFLNVKCDWTKAPLSVVQCDECKLVFLNPRPDKELGMEYFNNAYANNEGYEEIEYYRNDAFILERNQQRFDSIKNAKVPNNKILDIGAGQAHFLEICRRNGKDIYGTEISTAAVSVAKEKFNIDLQPDISHFEGEQFGIITLWDVIEHLENPKEVLLELSKYLHEDGIFVIETGDIDSFDFLFNKKKWSYWHIDHYFYFSKKTLTNLLKRINFELVTVPSAGNGQKKSNTKRYLKYLRPSNFILAFKGVYYSMTKKDFSRSSLMILFAKKVKNNANKVEA